MSASLESQLQALEALVQAQSRRLDALEGTKGASARQLGALYAQARIMKARGDSLRAEVRAILNAHKGLRRLKAYAVLTLLKRDRPPSLRRIQEIIHEVEHESAR